MAELVDAQVSGTCDRFGRGSSSLLQGTKKTSLCGGFFVPSKKRFLELPEWKFDKEEQARRSIAALATTKRRSETSQASSAKRKFCKKGHQKDLPMRRFFCAHKKKISRTSGVEV